MPKRGRPPKRESSATKTQEQEKNLGEAKSNEDRMKIIKEISQQVILNNGAHLGTLGGSMAVSEEVRGVIPTGSLGFDHALGVGGWPRGRIIEIFGRESSGKTTLALHAIAECQRLGGTAAFIDAEHALDPIYAAAVGVDTDTLLFHQPSSGEDALQTVQKIVDTGSVDLVVVDSVAALTPKAELEGDIGDAHVGLQARLMGQAMRILCGRLLRTNTVIIFLNQVRFKVSTGGGHGGPQTTTPGGEALKFYASVRVEVVRIGQLNQNDERYGNRVRLEAVKNKVSPPFRRVEVDIIFGEGISTCGELVDFGVEAGVIQKAGAWYSCGELRLGQGKDNAMSKIKSDPALYDDLMRQVRAYLEKR